jgi:hypothetical protein
MCLLSRFYDLYFFRAGKQESGLHFCGGCPSGERECNWLSGTQLLVLIPELSAKVPGRSSLQDILQNGVGDYDTAEDVYNYLNETFIQTVWADPICGDGVCDQPVETEGFGRFGCTIDCGAMDTVDVRFQFTTTFGSAADQAAADWNVCETFPDRLCW